MRISAATRSFCGPKPDERPENAENGEMRGDRGKGPETLGLSPYVRIYLSHKIYYGKFSRIRLTLRRLIRKLRMKVFLNVSLVCLGLCATLIGTRRLRNALHTHELRQLDPVSAQSIVEFFHHIAELVASHIRHGDDDLAHHIRCRGKIERAREALLSALSSGMKPCDAIGLISWRFDVAKTTLELWWKQERIKRREATRLQKMKEAYRAFTNDEPVSKIANELRLSRTTIYNYRRKWGKLQKRRAA